MMKLCTRFVRGDFPALFSARLPKSTLWAKTAVQIQDGSYPACRQLKTSCVVWSQEKLELSKAISVKETESPLILSVIDILEGYGFEKEEITQLFKSQPRLVNSSVNSWSELVKFLYTLSFEKDEVIRILELWPEILRCNTSLLEKTFIAWSDTGIGQQLLFSLLTTHPMFLSLDSRHVLKRVKQYQAYFESKNRVGKLLMLAPDVLEEKWQTVCDKLNFLDELCTDKSDIVSTGVLRHTLFHVRARHEFLIRAGLYKMPKKDFNKKLSKNPSLDSIVNTTDEEFVSKVAKLSLFEYNVFLDFFQQESEETDDDDNDDYDSDDETTYGQNYKLQYRNVSKKKNTL